MTPKKPDITPIVEFDSCRYAPWGDGNGLGLNMSIYPEDVIAVMSDSNEDAHLLFRAIASLERPLKGRLLYKGSPLDFSDYRKTLPYKKKIGYVALDAALLSNRSLGENLLISRRYFDNKAHAELDRETIELCRRLEINNKLNLFPGEAYKEDIRLTLIIREISKKPEILLVERPSTHLDHESQLQFIRELKNLTKMALVFYSFNQELVHDISLKKARIMKGRVDISPYNRKQDHLDLTPGSAVARGTE